jgi:hypothetical protein
LFEVSAGKINEVRHYNNKDYRDFKKRQFQAYQKTPEYEEELKRGTADGKYTKEEIAVSIEFWIIWRTKKFLVK